MEHDASRTAPVRPPRPLLVHVAVDAAVAFLALLVIGLILGFGLVEIAVAALVVGAVAGPFTRRAEVRALAARAAAPDDDTQ